MIRLGLFRTKEEGMKVIEIAFCILGCICIWHLPHCCVFSPCGIGLSRYLVVRLENMWIASRKSIVLSNLMKPMLDKLAEVWELSSLPSCYINLRLSYVKSFIIDFLGECYHLEQPRTSWEH